GSARLRRAGRRADGALPAGSARRGGGRRRRGRVPRLRGRSVGDGRDRRRRRRALRGVSAGLAGPPRVVGVLPAALDWQPVVSFDLARDRRRQLERVTTALEPRVEIVHSAVAVTANEAAEAGERGARGGAEAVLVVATMAVLPGVPMAALERLPGLPAVVWALQQGDRLASDVGHERIVTDGGTVGAPMLTSVL